MHKGRRDVKDEASPSAGAFSRRSRQDDSGGGRRMIFVVPIRVYSFFKCVPNRGLSPRPATLKVSCKLGSVPHNSFGDVLTRVQRYGAVALRHGLVARPNRPSHPSRPGCPVSPSCPSLAALIPVWVFMRESLTFPTSKPLTLQTVVRTSCAKIVLFLIKSSTTFAHDPHTMPTRPLHHAHERVNPQTSCMVCPHSPRP